MATETVPFSPFWTQQNGLNANIIDRNLAAIKAALDQANATIVKQQKTINNFFAGDTIVVGPAGPAGPPGMDFGGQDEGRDTIQLGPPGENLIFSTGLTKSGHVVTANLSTGIAGGQSVIGGTGPSENLIYSSTTGSPKGLHIWGTTLGMTFNEASNQLLIGTTSAFTQAVVEVVKSTNAGVAFTFVNPNAGGSAYTAFFLAQDSTLATGATFGTFLFSSGSTFGQPYGPNYGVFELAGGAGNMHFWIQQDAGDFGWFTRLIFPNPPLRMRLTNGGVLQVDPNAALTSGSTLEVGTSSGHNDWIVSATRSRNGVVAMTVSNTSTGTTASGGFIVTQNATAYGTNQFYFLLQSTGYTTIGPYSANSAIIEHVTNTAAASLVFSATGPQAIEFYTTGAYALRLKIANTGTITVPNLSAGGVVYSTAGSGLLKIGTSSEVASAITWPAADSVLVSSGTTTAPVARTTFRVGADDVVEISSDLTFAIYNLGSASTGNYERVHGFWSGNVFTLKSQKGGTGTVRAITIDADTSTLTLRGNNVEHHGATGASVGYLAGVVSTPSVLIAGTTSVAITAGSAGSAHPAASWAPSQMLIDTSIALSGGFPAGSVWDGLKITGASTYVPGTGTITAAFASTTFNAPSVSGDSVGATINEAATILIKGAPTSSGIAINAAFSLWNQGGTIRTDGGITPGGGAAATLANIGGSGPGTAAQFKWIPWNVDGQAGFIPFWK